MFKEWCASQVLSGHKTLRHQISKNIEHIVCPAADNMSTVTGAELSKDIIIISQIVLSFISNNIIGTAALSRHKCAIIMIATTIYNFKIGNTYFTSLDIQLNEYAEFE